MLAREQTTAMTGISTLNKKMSPEDLFEDKGIRVKLNPPACSSVEWAEKASYRARRQYFNVLKYLKGQPVQFCPTGRRIFLLDHYFIHLLDNVKKALYNKGYLLRIIPGGITCDVQRNDTDFHHPVKRYYRTLEKQLLLEKLRTYSLGI